MKNVKKTMQRIRKAEAELSYATPARAAKLAGKIVRLKATVFDGRD
ncbi:MAG: hypothetical protein IJX91_05155 [Clostridia bacterium]|nr:hypothetical protein [Clostridia bacterium]